MLDRARTVYINPRYRAEDELLSSYGPSDKDGRRRDWEKCSIIKGPVYLRWAKAAPGPARQGVDSFEELI